MIEKAIITDGSEEEITEYCLKFCLTRYEKANNITIQHYTLIAENDEIKLYAVLKSDNSTSLFVLFRCGAYSEFWSFWMLTKKQFDFLMNDVVNVYTKIEQQNQLHRKR